MRSWLGVETEPYQTAEEAFGGVEKMPNPHLQDYENARDYLDAAWFTLGALPYLCEDIEHIRHSFADAVACAFYLFAETTDAGLSAVAWEIARLIHLRCAVEQVIGLEGVPGLLEGDELTESEGYQAEMSTFIEAALEGHYGSALNVAVALADRLRKTEYKDQTLQVILTFLGEVMLVTSMAWFAQAFPDNVGLDESAETSE